MGRRRAGLLDLHCLDYLYGYDLASCWDLIIILFGCIYEIIKWLLEVFVVFRCDVFIPVEILCMSIVDHSKT